MEHPAEYRLPCQFCPRHTFLPWWNVQQSNRQCGAVRNIWNDISTKQGFVLPPLLFSIFFAMVLLVTFKDYALWMLIRFRTNGSIFNLQWLQVGTKTFSAFLHDLLYADDHTLLANGQSNAELLFDKFRTTATCFDLSISWKKTEVMVQSHSTSVHLPPAIYTSDVQLPAADIFCYLDSIISSNVTIDNDIN